MAAELGSEASAAVHSERQRVVLIEMQAQRALADERAKLLNQEANARNVEEFAERLVREAEESASIAAERVEEAAQQNRRTEQYADHIFTATTGDLQRKSVNKITQIEMQANTAMEDRERAWQ